MTDTGVLVAKGTKIYISPNVHDTDIDAMTDANAILEYEAITGWLQIEDVTSYGEFGAQSELITHMPVDTGVVNKYKGTTNYGQISLQMARRTAATGQAKLIEAQKSLQSYDFKVEYSDADYDGITTGTVQYFAGKVMSYTNNVGQVNNVIQAAATIEIDGRFLEVEAT